jgi:hypothetical protein
MVAAVIFKQDRPTQIPSDDPALIHSAPHVSLMAFLSVPIVALHFPIYGTEPPRGGKKYSTEHDFLSSVPA